MRRLTEHGECSLNDMPRMMIKEKQTKTSTIHTILIQIVTLACSPAVSKATTPIVVNTPAKKDTITKNVWSMQRLLVLVSIVERQFLARQATEMVRVIIRIIKKARPRYIHIFLSVPLLPLCRSSSMPALVNVIRRLITGLSSVQGVLARSNTGEGG
ncbi:hypothetical protein [Candidatus Similichlamydia laticola]|uniref:hypothetical protein n=1 Tax=Candidatus Similichlamydia laticola TaxID=2170265 RepID=UPI0011C0514E|nr:hypothetical protein [Candidatus Similichlamydia laticola]